jgi:hypothetical protein
MRADNETPLFSNSILRFDKNLDDRMMLCQNVNGLDLFISVQDLCLKIL